MKLETVKSTSLVRETNVSPITVLIFEGTDRLHSLRRETQGAHVGH